MQKLDAEITTQQSTERMLREHTDLFDMLFQQSPFAIVVRDREGKISLTNPAFSEVYGYAPQECVGRTLNDVLAAPGVEVELDRDLADQMKGITVHRKAKRKRKDGTVLDVEVHGVPLFVEGQFCGTFAIYQDLTKQEAVEKALRQSEEVFRMLSDASPVGIFRTDEKGTPLYTNQRLTEITGLSAEQAIRGGWSEAIHLDDRQRVKEAWQNSVERGDGFSKEYRFVKQDGEIVWVAAHATPIRGAHGRVDSYVGVIEDRTALRKA